MYNIITNLEYIPTTNSGDKNFLVLESENDDIEAKCIYVLFDNISSFDLINCDRNRPYINLFVTGRNEPIKLCEDQREILINLINMYMDEPDDDSSTSSH